MLWETFNAAEIMSLSSAGSFYLMTLVSVYAFSSVKPCTDNFPNHVQSVQLMCVCEHLDGLNAEHKFRV